jgi:DNA helicase II / ATP-dependent DNA helicase PcrA
MTDSVHPLFTDLNPPQRAAVDTLDGPVLVLAGAGTGKTKALTARLANLLLQGKASPFQIFAVTFTNKAAREMSDRVARLVGRGTKGWWLGTFHSLAARFLRQHAERVGLKPTFTILDTDDQLRLLKQLLEAENIDTKQNPPRVLLAQISRWKDKGQTPETASPFDAGMVADGRAHALYRQYQDRLLTLNACDFGDLILHNLTLLQQNPDLLEDAHRRFRYILVDEYQDTNTAQYLWLRLLAQGSRNICCVGDDDQSIYGWRGADVGNILRFESDFPGAAVVRLEQNYRSTGHILAAASGVISCNEGRFGKSLWTEAEDGEPVRIHGCWDGEDEARWIGDEVESLQRRGTDLRDMAVLVRAGFQTREFEERFIQIGVPYRVIGGPRFYERQEIRDALAYLRLTISPADDLAFERIINTPKRGIGDATLQQLHAAARTLQLPLLETASRLADTDELKPKMRKTLSALCADFTRWRDALSRDPHTDVAARILDESGYTAMWLADKSPESAGRLENLKELISALAEFDTLPAFLEHVSLVMEMAESTDADLITLMTMHAAKGLEFDVVFLPGWEEDLFPSRRSIEEKGMEGLEEERRLAYVALTRARKLATITHAGNRCIYGKWTGCNPSRFLDELPEANINVDSEVQLSIGGQFGKNQFGGRQFGGNRLTGLSSGFSDAAFTEIPSPPSLRAQRSNPEMVQAGRSLDCFAALATTPEKTSTTPYPPGTRITHATFGPGTILSADRDKLDIQFDRAGRKKIIDRFVTKENRAAG